MTHIPLCLSLENMIQGDVVIDHFIYVMTHSALATLILPS
jgi:hypothetical protein